MSTTLNTAEHRLPRAVKLVAPVEQPVIRQPKFTIRHPEVIITALVINIAAGLVALMVLMASPAGSVNDYHDTVSGDTNVVAQPKASQTAKPKAKHAVVVPTNGKLGKQAAAWLKASDPSGYYRKQRLANIALVVSMGHNVWNTDDRTIAIAVGTCIQESKCTNWKGGDRDSAGLFQQRPSVKAWGTYAQIIDRKHAINEFYSRLVRLPNRQARPMMVIASEVQIPGMEYYIRDWYWDQIAPQFVKYFSADKKA